MHAQVHKLAELEAACEVASAARLAGVPKPQHAATATTLLGSFGGSTGTADAPEAAADARALLAMLQAMLRSRSARCGACLATRCNTWQHVSTRGNAVQHVATRCNISQACTRADRRGAEPRNAALLRRTRDCGLRRKRLQH